MSGIRSIRWNEPVLHDTVGLLYRSGLMVNFFGFRQAFHSHSVGLGLTE